MPKDKRGGKRADSIKNKKTSSLNKSIKGFNRTITEHKDKIANPRKYAPEYDSLDTRRQRGMIRFWEKEIANAEQQILDHQKELERRNNDKG